MDQRGIVISKDGIVRFDETAHPHLKGLLIEDLQALDIPVQLHPEGLHIPDHHLHTHKFAAAVTVG